MLSGQKKASDRADYQEGVAQQSERVRARECELVKKPAFEKRERELELGQAAKRNLMSLVNKFQSLPLKEMRTKRKEQQLKLAHKLKSLNIYSAL